MPDSRRAVESGLYGRLRAGRHRRPSRKPQASARTVRKWVDRYRREGLAGLQDRSSRPHRLRLPTPAAAVVEIERLRRQRWTGKQIAVQVGVSPATVSRVLRRTGLRDLPEDLVCRDGASYLALRSLVRPHAGDASPTRASRSHLAPTIGSADSTSLGEPGYWLRITAKLQEHHRCRNFSVVSAALAPFRHLPQ